MIQSRGVPVNLFSWSLFSYTFSSRQGDGARFTLDSTVTDRKAGPGPIYTLTQSYRMQQLYRVSSS